MESKKIHISNLRLWHNNPRYSLDSLINVADVGQEDFSVDEEFVEKDTYEENYEKYFKKLINNFDALVSTTDLLESLSEGFDPEIDDVFVVKPENIINKIGIGKAFDYINDIYYVVEGNRRLMCLDILFNYHKSRQILNNIKQEFIASSKKAEENLIKKIMKICQEYDAKNKPHPDYIECKELEYNESISENGKKKLNKLLNSRHFGNKKGKLNWPRGLILKKIFKLVKSFIKLNPDISMTEISKNVENFVGKKITSQDINSALFVNDCIEIWNSREKDDKINWDNTETGDINLVENIVLLNDDGDELASSSEKVGFYVSSLENSKSNIKLLDHKFEVKTLGAITKMEFSVKALIKDEEYVKIKLKEDGTYLSQKQKEDIFYLIVKGVKNGDINTRSSNKDKITNTGKLIREVIYPAEIIPVQKVFSLNLEQLISMGKINDDNKDYVVINSIISNLNDMVNNYRAEFFNFKEEFNYENIINVILGYIWKTEYGRVVKFKDKITLNDIPTLIFAFLYRTTFEFLISFLSINLFINYLEKLKLNVNYVPKTDFDFAEERVAKQVDGHAYEDLFLKNGEKVKSIISYFKLENIKEKEKIIEDIRLMFYINFGIEDIALKNRDIDFKYFDSINNFKEFSKGFYGQKHSYKNYFDVFSKTNKDLIDVLENKFLEDGNILNLISNEEKINAFFEIIRIFLIDLHDNKIQNYKIINKCIHTPLYSMNTYFKNNNSLDQINTILELFKRIEELIYILVK